MFEFIKGWFSRKKAGSVERVCKSSEPKARNTNGLVTKNAGQFDDLAASKIELRSEKKVPCSTCGKQVLEWKARRNKGQCYECISKSVLQDSASSKAELEKGKTVPCSKCGRLMYKSSARRHKGLCVDCRKDTFPSPSKNSTSNTRPFTFDMREMVMLSRKSIEPEIIWIPTSTSLKYGLLKTPSKIQYKSKLVNFTDVKFQFKSFFFLNINACNIFLIINYPLFRREFIFSFLAPMPATKEYFNWLISTPQIFFNDEPDISSSISFTIDDISLFTGVLRSCNLKLGSEYFSLKY